MTCMCIFPVGAMMSVCLECAFLLVLLAATVCVAKVLQCQPQPSGGPLVDLCKSPLEERVPSIKNNVIQFPLMSTSIMQQSCFQERHLPQGAHRIK